MQFLIIGIVLLAVETSATIPSYFKVCGRRDPNLDTCVLSAVDALRDKFVTGIPELGTPSLDPLYLEGFPLSQTDVLKAYARNVKFSGLSNFEADRFHVDFEHKRFDIVVFFKRVILDADYNVKARIVVPISRHGPIHIVSEDVRADVTLRYKILRRNGKEYMFFPTMTTKLNIKDFHAEFKPVEQDPENAVGTAINSAIQGGRQEIIQAITPTIEKVISAEVLKIANNICMHFTFDELFPDRE